MGEDFTFPTLTPVQCGAKKLPFPHFTSPPPWFIIPDDAGAHDHHRRCFGRRGCRKANNDIYPGPRGALRDKCTARQGFTYFVELHLCLSIRTTSYVAIQKNRILRVGSLQGRPGEKSLVLQPPPPPPIHLRSSSPEAAAGKPLAPPVKGMAGP
ncbi:hypothetical protein ZWY2020_028511 [Hordeum vulgare]|nr:hypothetical protein ZWY2020_028511 [Hordeum vulgare]